jgi:hypothetical protein
MVEPPRVLDGAQVVAYAIVTGDVAATGATRHVVGDSEMGPAAALAIACYPDVEDFYLFYLDEGGEVVTDTLHRSLAGAMRQAAFEYVGLSWTEVGSDEG